MCPRNRCRVIVLAGGIASGKSSVACFFAGWGAVRLDLDELSREVVEPPSTVLDALADAFGGDVLAPDGSLRRGLLAERAFASEAGTQRLEAIVHPAVMALLDERLRSLDAGSVAVVEVPLLDRVPGLVDEADVVVCVVAPLLLRRERAIERGMSGEDFDARVARQPTDEYLIDHADEVIVNDSDEATLAARARELWQSLAAGWRG